MTLILAAIGAAWAAPALGGLRLGDQPVPVARTTYVVREGDTLWSIAKRLSPGHDPRPAVDALQTANAVDPGMLVPGSTLVVPGGV